MDQIHYYFTPDKSIKDFDDKLYMTMSKYSRSRTASHIPVPKDGRLTRLILFSRGKWFTATHSSIIINVVKNGESLHPGQIKINSNFFDLGRIVSRRKESQPNIDFKAGDTIGMFFRIWEQYNTVYSSVLAIYEPHE